jgi:hypothetical protein
LGVSDVLPADEIHRILEPYPPDGMEVYPESMRAGDFTGEGVVRDF